MKRLIGFIFRLLVVTAFAVWLAREPGTVHIVWHDRIIETSAAFFTGAVLLLGFLFYRVFRLWYVFRHGHSLWRLDRRYRKLKRGQDYLTQGLIAVASGDAADAGQLSVQARRFLGPTPATQLLQAQAAQMAGDHQAAREIYRALANESESAVLGYRGLIMDARRRHDYDEMMRLAEGLRRQKPDTPWLNFIRFTLATQQQNWLEAGEAVADQSLAPILGEAALKRARSALLITRSREEHAHNHLDEALQAAEQAARQAPDWLPAILTLAESQLASGQRRAGLRWIERKWKTNAHPDLAKLYRDTEKDPIEGFKRVKELCEGTPDLPLSHQVLAEAALAADLWGEARRHLMALIAAEQATQSTYRMMARLERRESGDDQASLQWMTRAVDSTPDARWICRSCGSAHAQWQASCTACGQFVTLEWQRPGVRRNERPIQEPLEIDHDGGF